MIPEESLGLGMFSYLKVSNGTRDIAPSNGSMMAVTCAGIFFRPDGIQSGEVAIAASVAVLEVTVA